MRQYLAVYKAPSGGLRVPASTLVALFPKQRTLLENLDKLPLGTPRPQLELMTMIRAGELLPAWPTNSTISAIDIEMDGLVDRKLVVTFTDARNTAHPEQYVYLSKAAKLKYRNDCQTRGLFGKIFAAEERANAQTGDVFELKLSLRTVKNHADVCDISTPDTGVIRDHRFAVAYEDDSLSVTHLSVNDPELQAEYLQLCAEMAKLARDFIRKHGSAFSAPNASAVAEKPVPSTVQTDTKREPYHVGYATSPC